MYSSKEGSSALLIDACRKDSSKGTVDALNSLYNLGFISDKSFLTPGRLGSSINWLVDVDFFVSIMLFDGDNDDDGLESDMIDFSFVRTAGDAFEEKEELLLKGIDRQVEIMAGYYANLI